MCPHPGTSQPQSAEVDHKHMCDVLVSFAACLSCAMLCGEAPRLPVQAGPPASCYSDCHRSGHRSTQVKPQAQLTPQSSETYHQKHGKSAAPGVPRACRDEAGTCAMGTACSRAFPARTSHCSGPANLNPSTRTPSSLLLYPSTAILKSSPQSSS